MFKPESVSYGKTWLSQVKRKKSQKNCKPNKTKTS